MKIKLAELRKVIRGVLKEAAPAQRPTISSDLDPGEKELQDKFPKWGNTQNKKLKHDSPAAVKTSLVTQILRAKGLTADAGNQKKIVQGLQSFIEKMDPAEAFAADPDDIATEFATKVLGVNNN